MADDDADVAPTLDITDNDKGEKEDDFNLLLDYIEAELEGKKVRGQRPHILPRRTVTSCSTRTSPSQVK